MDVITVNISGRPFQMTQKTFKLMSENIPSRLQNTTGQKELCFERHAEIFQNILCYYQTGELHMPQCACPLLFKQELDFWGVDVTALAKCCYNRYGIFQEDYKNLETYEKYFMASEDQRNPATKFGRLRRGMWKFLNDPFSSAAAQIYFWLSMALVAVGITVSCISTLGTMQNKQLRELPEWLQDYIQRHYGEHLSRSQDGNSTTGSIESPSILDVKLSFSQYIFVDMAICVLFTIELVFKLLTCPSFKTFFTSVINVVDLLAVLPFYVWIILDALFPYGDYIERAEQVLEAMLVLRVCRLFRLVRRIRGLRVIIYALKSSIYDLFLLTLMVLMAMVVFASLMYYVDTFPSIPHGFWWAVVTMTTVGYGDMVPNTAAGKLVGSLCAMTGVIIVALTVPVFVSKFLLYYTSVDKPNSGLDKRNSRPNFSK